MLEVTAQQVRAMRLRAQRLHPRAARGDAADVVRTLCGVNAQFRPAMMLALRARLRGAKPHDVTDLTDVRRTLVRTWAMRGTLHLLFWDDPGWLLPLISPAIIGKTRGRRRELGLDVEKLAQGLREIQVVLGDAKPLTRAELVDRLNDRCLGIEPTGQAAYHLIACAGLEGVVILGPERPDGEQTYVLSDRLAGSRRALPKEKALAELANRYLEGYGPASPADFAAWSGLSMTDAKKGWELLKDRGLLGDILAEGRVLGALDTGLKSIEPAPASQVVNLLPAFDTLALGYSDREFVVPGRYYKEIYRGGQTVPVVLVDGAAAGVWRYEIKGKLISLEVRPFEAFDRCIKDLVEEEAEDIGRFFGLAPTLAFSGR